MKDADWRALVEEYSQQGLDLLARWRTELPGLVEWKANYTEMAQHVRWLCELITPADNYRPRNEYKSKNQLAERDHMSEFAIDAGARKAAKLLGILRSSGAKGAPGAKALGAHVYKLLSSFTDLSTVTGGKL